MNGIALIASGLAALSVATAAEEDIIYDFNVDQLKVFVENLGWEAEQVTMNGNLVLQTKSSNNLIILLAPTACLDDGKCVGLQTVANFDLGLSPEAVLEFENRYVFAGITIGETSITISRYDISDYGMARGNLEVILTSFDDIAAKFSNFSYEQDAQ